MLGMEGHYEKYSGVADLYGVYVDAMFDIPFWINESRKSGKVLEMTSGAGRVTIPLAKSGIRVTALDISEDLVHVLGKKAERERLDIEIHEAGIRSFRPDRKFPLIIMRFNSMQEIMIPSIARRSFCE
jgi:2-polyprenyl-3-methyl-5-hydroxy-6-metoxy-1,4-benzoquinol methylase